MAEKKETPAATIIFSLPPVITVEHWDAYCAGSQDYMKANPQNNVVHGDYAGALALIRRGFVQYRTDSDKIKGWIEASDQSMIPAAFMGLVVREVARRVDAAISGPLEI